MPRPPSLERQKKWKLSINATIAGRVELELMDPVHRKPIYGERSKLVEQLLSEWLEKRRQEKEPHHSPMNIADTSKLKD